MAWVPVFLLCQQMARRYREDNERIEKRKQEQAKQDASGNFPIDNNGETVLTEQETPL